MVPCPWAPALSLGEFQHLHDDDLEDLTIFVLPGSNRLLCLHPFLAMSMKLQCPVKLTWSMHIEKRVKYSASELPRLQGGAS